MLGSLSGVQLAQFEWQAFASLALAGCVLFPILILLLVPLPDFRQDMESVAHGRSWAGIPPGLLPIIIVVFGATITEGAMSDWATVYMREADWGGTARDGLAITVYAGMITFGRFVGDSINIRFGPVFLARFCLLFAIIGVLVLVFSNSMKMSLIGFGFVGFGVSAIFPLGVSATSRLSAQNQARNVSVMTFGALTGFLIGPPLIGLVADYQDLRFGLALLLPMLALSFALSGRFAVR